MTTALFTHRSSLDHQTPPGHPERADRIRAIAAALETERFTLLDRREAPAAEDAHILRAHPQSHLDAIRAAAPADGFRALDPDTHMSPGSLTAAYHAAGGAVAAVDAVLSGDVANAFVAARPPGHHAEKTRPMGFCLFSNAAIGVLHAIEAHGLARVAVVDFDVHHGNGTQNVFWDDPRVLYASTHQMPLYPGSGAASETGAGNIVNAPLDPFTGSREMRRAYEDTILPAVDAFAPELIVVSAGFDAHARDPLANLDWLDEDFVWVTERLCDAAMVHCNGRIVSTLEGGYDLQALAGACAAHVGVLMERGA